MVVISKAIEEWRTMDPEVKREIIDSIEIGYESSEMVDDKHPKRDEFVRAFNLVIEMLKS